LAGLAAGFLNVLAGGGSLLTLPALMLLGLPADLANGSNRLSIISQSLSGAWSFRRSGKLDARAIAPIILPALIGSLLGSLAASRVPVALLKYVLLGTMMAMAALLALAPRALTAAAEEPVRWHDRRLAGIAGLLGAGLYGGFVQAGVGFLLLSVLGGVLRYDLVRANALKLVCTAVFGLVAFGVFAASGQVVWLPAVLLAVYTMIGSLLGVRFALHVRQVVIRWIIFVAVIATCLAALLKG
jgi:uncharacterized protein